ncbi:unnamed protein product [Ectocarpus sp. 12 AP-2014]
MSICRCLSVKFPFLFPIVSLPSVLRSGVVSDVSPFFHLFVALPFVHITKQRLLLLQLRLLPRLPLLLQLRLLLLLLPPPPQQLLLLLIWLRRMRQQKTFVDQGYTEDEVREALVSQNEACPTFSLTECQRQVFRGSISSLSVCDNTTEGVDCSTVGSLEPVRCMEESEYPTDLWQNTDFAGWDYTQRTCCGSNFTSTSTEPSCSISDEEDDSGGGGNTEGVRWGEGRRCLLLLPLSGDVAFTRGRSKL